MNDAKKAMAADEIERQVQQVTHYRPWVGVIASVLLPGAGQYLAGEKRRGLCWCVFFAFLEFAGGLLESAPVVIPSALEWTKFGLCLAIWLFMLRDACRPIPRMLTRGWSALVLMAVALFVAEMLLILCFVRPFKIPTRTMEPTLRGHVRRPDGTVERETGDHVLVQRFGYWFSKPRRGDIVVFRTRGLKGTRGDFYCKRVVGLPGEKISIKAGKLVVNGSPVSEPPIFKRIQYVHPTEAKYLKTENDEFVVPGGHYFVLGDNSENSADSRYWGAMPEANIYGKVTKIFRPPERVGVPE